MQARVNQSLSQCVLFTVHCTVMNDGKWRTANCLLLIQFSASARNNLFMQLQIIVLALRTLQFTFCWKYYFIISKMGQKRDQKKEETENKKKTCNNKLKPKRSKRREWSNNASGISTGFHGICFFAKHWKCYICSSQCVVNIDLTKTHSIGTCFAFPLLHIPFVCLLIN